MDSSPEKKITEGVLQLVDRKLSGIVRPGWLPCKQFGLSARKAERLGLRVSHFGKTPYLNVDEFNAHAEQHVKPQNNTNDLDEVQRAFGVAPKRKGAA